MKLCAVQWPVVGLSLLFLVGSCQSDLTNPNKAYPTASAVSAGSKPGKGANLATLERGRKIYTTSCTECHVARTIGNYSISQWQHYLSIMAPRAELGTDDRAALETYVIKARQSLGAGSEPEAGN
jgi:cytochrome c5